MIPKILHFIWVGDETKRPDNCIDTWIIRHPSWNVKIWGNSDLIESAWINFRHMKEMSKFELNGLADIMRWEILFNHGGVLVDADSVCIRALDDNLLECEAFACWENEIARPGLIAAGYFGCVAGNTFVGKIINDILKEESVVNNMAWKTVGPQRLTDSYRKYNYQSLRIYPSHYFIPEHFTGVVYDGSGPIYAYQEWASTRNKYDELYLKPVEKVGRALAKNNPYSFDSIAKNNQSIIGNEKAVPLKKSILPPLELDHEKFFIQSVEVSAEITDLSRLDVFSKLCQGQRVIHIGCADWPITDPNFSLHVCLQPYCSTLDGLDTNKNALSSLREHVKGNLYNLYEDVKGEYDLILVPEVMEHVSDVCYFLSQLDQIRAPSIVITVPDAFQCYKKHFHYSDASSIFTEIVHPDHNCWYTPYTLSNVIKKYTNWKIEGIWFFNQISIMMLLSK